MRVLNKLLFTSMDFVRSESAVLTEAIHVIKVESTTSPTVKFQFRSIGEARLDNVAALTTQVHPKYLDWGSMCGPPYALLAITSFFVHGGKYAVD